jgi:hypothetical protein
MDSEHAGMEEGEKRVEMQEDVVLQGTTGEYGRAKKV